MELEKEATQSTPTEKRVEIALSTVSRIVTYSTKPRCSVTVIQLTAKLTAKTIVNNSNYSGLLTTRAR